MSEKYFNRMQDSLASEDASPQLLEAVFRSRQNLERLESSCNDLNTQSAAGWCQYEDFGGDGFVNLKHGYTKLTDYLRSQLPADAVKLNEVVENIDYSNGMVKVTAVNSKDKKRTTYEANYVLCTLPVGVLKEEHDHMFTPKLPAEKIQAIESLGFGCMNKYFFVFDQDLDKDMSGCQVFWREDLPFTLEASKKWNLKVQLLFILALAFATFLLVLV